MTPQEIEALKAERDALAAQFEALRSAYQNLCEAIDDMDNCEEGTAEMETAIDEMFHAMRNGYNKVHATPQQCLREIEAAAGRAGFIECSTRWNFCNAFGEFVSPEEIEAVANEYATTVRQGGAE